MANRRGFTLIELMLVVTIIGILTSMSIPKFGSTKEKAYLATMKADLRNLVVAEEAYFFDWSAYTASLPLTVYDVTTGSRPPTIRLTSDGWTANLTHTHTTQTCSIFIGSTPQTPAITEGEPRCQ